MSTTTVPIWIVMNYFSAAPLVQISYRGAVVQNVPKLHGYVCMKRWTDPNRFVGVVLLPESLDEVKYPCLCLRKNYC